MGDTGEITRILEEMRSGVPGAMPRLLEAVHAELHSIAERHLRRERCDHTLQPTALLNEAWLQLVDQREQHWENKAHFLGVAAVAMRRVLMHHAERIRAQKRGGGRVRVTLFEAASVFEERVDDLLALDEALTRLAAEDPIHARIVELRFFGGLTVDEVAKIMEVPVRTVERGWRTTRAWLRHQIEKDAEEASRGENA